MGDPHNSLAQMTTLRVGGPAAQVINADTEEQLLEVLHDRRFSMIGDTPLLVVGGGSNLVVSDQPFPGVVLRDVRDGMHVRDSTTCDGVAVEVEAGVNWDWFVQWTISEEFSGVSFLSGIPGSVGAAPIQNIGAYGREVGENLLSVKVYDRFEGRVFSLPKSALELGYRDSAFKRSLHDREVGGGRTWSPTPRWVVLSVTLCLHRDPLSAPVRYSEVARLLDVELEDRVPLEEARDAVLQLRTSKGMVLNAEDHDTWSAGSFFTNPILEEAEANKLLPLAAPRYPTELPAHMQKTPVKKTENPKRYVKTSAAWLMEKAGFHKGFGLTEDAPARLSTKHVLAITNRGGATSRDVLELAKAVRAGVSEYFGINLQPEPVLVGLDIETS